MAVLRRGLLCAASLASILVISGCSPIDEWFSSSKRVRAAGSSVKPDKERKAAPEFELKDGDGRTVRLSDYKGKIVLLNFWATWCGPCRIEMPWFIEFERQYKDKGFAMIGISMDEEGWTAVKPFITEMAVNYRVLLGNDQTAELYGGVSALPTSFLIDQEGKVAATHVGLVGKDVFEDGIKALLDSAPRAGRAPAAALLVGTK